MAFSKLKNISGILSIVILSTAMGVSSSQWIIVWVCLEVNTIALCLLVSNDNQEEEKNQSNTIIYYAIQVIASLLIIIFSSQENSTPTTLLVTAGVLIKVGAWPFHLWYLNIISLIEINQSSVMVLITWQNILPLTILSIIALNSTTSNVVALVSLVTLITPTQNINSLSSVNSIIALSSINNNSWLIVALMCSINVFLMFLSLYSLTLLASLNILENLKINSMNTTKSFWVIVLVLSNLGGLPPLTMFWGNVIALNDALESNVPSEMCILIVLIACYFMYNYLWITINETTNIPQNIQNLKLENNESNIVTVIGVSSIGGMLLTMV